MSGLVSIYDREQFDELRRSAKIDPDIVRKWRNKLLKRFVSDDEARSGSPVADQVKLHTLELQHRRDSGFDGATKLLLKTAGRMLIETVILRVASGRTTLCLSSQIGCAAACEFCATGKMGIARNLSRDEMLDQLLIAGQLLALENRRVRNIVFMGMGEPFHNEENLYSTLDALTSPNLFHHSPTKILISTVGIIPGMRRCAERYPSVNLALSLHSVRQDVREQLVPLARLYPLDQLHQTIMEINTGTKSPMMLEYLLLADRNDSEADAAELIEWCQGLRVHVNLIPYNPIADASGNLKGSSQDVFERFANRLKNAGVTTTIRYSLGQDIAAACGQLAKNENRTLASLSNV